MIIIINDLRFCDYLTRSLNPTMLYVVYIYKLPRTHKTLRSELANLIISIVDPHDCRLFLSMCEISLQQQRNACSFPTPFPERISEMPDTPRTGLPVGSYTRAVVSPACRPENPLLLQLVEREFHPAYLQKSLQVR